MGQLYFAQPLYRPDNRPSDLKAKLPLVLIALQDDVNLAAKKLGLPLLNGQSYTYFDPKGGPYTGSNGTVTAEQIYRQVAADAKLKLTASTFPTLILDAEQGSLNVFRNTLPQWLNRISRPVTSLTSTGTTATIVLGEKSGLDVGLTIVVAGATPSGYNNSFVITQKIDDYTFKFNLTSPLSSPATGTITASGVVPTAVSKAEIDTTHTDLRTIASWVKTTAPELLIGYYGLNPAWGGWDDFNQNTYELTEYNKLLSVEHVNLSPYVNKSIPEAYVRGYASNVMAQFLIEWNRKIGIIKSKGVAAINPPLFLIYPYISEGPNKGDYLGRDDWKSLISTVVSSGYDAAFFALPSLVGSPSADDTEIWTVIREVLADQETQAPVTEPPTTTDPDGVPTEVNPPPPSTGTGGSTTPPGVPAGNPTPESPASTVYILDDYTRGVDGYPLANQIIFYTLVGRPNVSTGARIGQQQQMKSDADGRFRISLAPGYLYALRMKGGSEVEILAGVAGTSGTLPEALISGRVKYPWD